MVFFIAGIIIAALFILGFKFYRISLHPHRHDHEESFNYELEHESIKQKYYDVLEKEEFTADSDFGYKINGLWFPNRDTNGYESKRSVIIVHGYSVNMFTSLRFLKLFLDKGFNVLIYDQRFHGKSGGKNCSMGYYEKYDLRTLVTRVLDRTGFNSTVGIHGSSMGAATAVMHAAIDDRISFTVADCPYDDLNREFAHRLKKDYKLPVFPLMYISSLITRLSMGFFFNTVSPLKDVDYIKTPILFIHGEQDDYVPPSCSIRMYEKVRGKKGLYLAKNAGHGESIFVNRDAYEKVVYRFIDNLEPVKQQD
ncbi:MAG: alpha/beta hydrolase [Spirochaetales bacterium]|uniref:Alpha/beta hydrolase n=1 Tax=Candidatus Thalassospirochaeta sargassi TaxID=3119039 RepID=A0AAJ1MNL1_9SPIO|nr:alpha/beta hydrolase [Spirochaetales bacterium]